MSGNQPKIDVLLATFNGSRYVGELIDSIQCQSFDRWKLIVRDDCSSDTTLDIIRRYQRHSKGQIKIISDDKEKLGACQNFNRLLQHSASDYVMFCDQDDVWKKDKIKLTFDVLKKEEALHGKEIPILVHTDLEVTDAQLNLISNSFWRYQHLAPDLGSAFSRLLMQNVVTGSTVLLNRAAREIALPIPQEAIMHDWWFALVVSAFGKIQHFSQATVAYRQHEQNDTGAKQWSLRYILKKATTDFGPQPLRASISRCEKQAEAFLLRYESNLNSKQRDASNALAHLSQLDPIKRRWFIWRYRLFKIGWIRNIGLFLRV
jgi:glycosyltransferase involved in cell wall biosynthesis